MFWLRDKKNIFLLHTQWSQCLGHSAKFLNSVIFLSLKIQSDCFILVNSGDTYEMPHFVAFHLGLHCLPK